MFKVLTCYYLTVRFPHFVACNNFDWIKIIDDVKKNVKTLNG